jgi:hypothetical protein
MIYHCYNYPISFNFFSSLYRLSPYNLTWTSQNQTGKIRKFDEWN